MAIGIKDVARVAGVSPATVSRVLGGKAVDPTMKAAVEAAVAQTGYRPNMAARRLRSRHNGTIGLIVADIRNPFFTAVSRMVETIAYAHGLRVILCNTDEDHEKETLYLRLMQEERVAGVIIAPSRTAVETVGRETFDFPVVLIDRAVHGRRNDAVVLDNVAASAMLVEHLHGQGLTRITGLFGVSTTGQERRAGYMDAMTARGLSPDPQAVEHGEDDLRQMLASLLARTPPPQAIIGSNGILLLAVARASVAMGVRIPGDLILAGFDNEPWTEIFAGGVTVVEQPVDEIGRVAMMMLLERLETPDLPARKTVLSGRLVPRGH